MKIEDLLAKRQKSHGAYIWDAYYAQALKKIIRESKNWEKMTSVQQLTLEMICNKMARICAGNPNEGDHFLDIAGYAKLALDNLDK